jgi:hypothetical protein
MKVDMKIVPVEVEEKSGWFSTKKRAMHQLRYTIRLTDVEKAIIERAGLSKYVYLEVLCWGVNRECSEVLPLTIDGWFDGAEHEAWHNYDTLIEAQAAGQDLKANLVKVKELMDTHTQIGTEDSFEL